MKVIFEIKKDHNDTKTIITQLFQSALQIKEKEHQLYLLDALLIEMSRYYFNTSSGLIFIPDCSTLNNRAGVLK